MKKRLFLSLVAWVLYLGNTMADNIVINHVTVAKGGTVSLPVGFTFTSTTDKVGFTFCLGLPAGLSLAKDADGDPLYNKDASISKFNIVYTEGNFAGQPSNATTTISGTAGTLLTLQLCADNSLLAGSEHIVNVTKCTFQQRVDGTVTDIIIPDFTFKVTIDAEDDGRIHFDENSETLPTFTNGESYNVTMKRTIKGGEWSTLVLPFTLSKAKAEEIFGTDVTYAKFKSFTADYGDNLDNITPLGITITCEQFSVPARGGLQAGTPILIKTTQDITKPIEIDNIKLNATITDVSGSDKTDDYETSGIFTGSFVKTKIPVNGLFLSDNKFWYSTGKTNVKAFRCWFELGAVLDKETEDWGSRIYLVFDDSETTGISDAMRLNDHEYYYGLDGHKLAKRPVRKGVYVCDGKKVVIK